MRPAAVAVLVALAAFACADARLERAGRDADAYISGVQYRDALKVIKHQTSFRERIATLPSDRREAARDEALAEMRARLAEFDDAKVAGTLPLAADGIDLIQGLALGKGIFYAIDDVRADGPDRATAVMRVKPDYAEHRFRGLPPGTRVYFMGEPIGHVETVVLGESAAERTLRVVEEIQLEWHLRWFAAEEVYPEGWAVESVRPLPDSVRWTEIRRAF